MSIVHESESRYKEDDQHILYMQGRQQAFQSSNANNQGSGRGLHDVINDLIDVLAQGDSRTARWLTNQEVITLIN